MKEREAIRLWQDKHEARTHNVREAPGLDKVVKQKDKFCIETGHALKQLCTLATEIRNPQAKGFVIMNFSTSLSSYVVSTLSTVC